MRNFRERPPCPAGRRVQKLALETIVHAFLIDPHIGNDSPRCVHNRHNSCSSRQCWIVLDWLLIDSTGIMLNETKLLCRDRHMHVVRGAYLGAWGQRCMLATAAPSRRHARHPPSRRLCILVEIRHQQSGPFRRDGIVCGTTRVSLFPDALAHRHALARHATLGTLFFLE